MPEDDNKEEGDDAENKPAEGEEANFMDEDDPMPLPEDDDDKNNGDDGNEPVMMDDDDEPNDCKHCKAVDPPRQNCPLGNGTGSKSKCLCNPAYKGWRPDWICGRRVIVFKKKGKFSKALGGTKDELIIISKGY